MSRDLYFLTMVGGENCHKDVRSAGIAKKKILILREDLLRCYEDEVFPRLTILPFDLVSARIFGRIKADLARRGLARFEPDHQIASIALAHNLALVTGNVRHYEAIPGLRVENWMI